MNPNLDPQAPMQPQGSWFSRNWKWLVPVGCLVPMVCCGGIGGAAFFAASTMIKSSTAFTEAFARAGENDEVKEALGSPLKPGFGMSGEMKEKNEGGYADFTVPIEGPKGSGHLHVVARRSGGKWTFQRVEVEAGGKTIEVIGPKQRPDPVDVPEEADDEPDGD